MKNFITILENKLSEFNSGFRCFLCSLYIWKRYITGEFNSSLNWKYANGDSCDYNVFWESIE